VWDKNLPFPVNNTWGYHDAATGNGRYDLYYKEMVKRYGEPSGMEEFSNKMQLMNAIGYQGIFEAAGHKLNDIGGVMLWKLNAAFPSVVWQVYDWFLMPNAGYFFMQNACEPLHVQYNPVDKKVIAINRTYKSYRGLTASIDILDMNSKLLSHEEKVINLSATEVLETGSAAPALSGSTGVSFIVLNLKNSAGKVVSHNVYWVSNGSDYKAIAEMPKTKVDVKVLTRVKGKNENGWTIQVTNNSDKIAFFIRPQLIAGEEEVLPSFWTGSYFTLAPSESATVTVSCPVDKLNGKVPSIKISGWNVDLQNVAVK
jgi:hypothetical protein